MTKSRRRTATAENLPFRFRQVSGVHLDTLKCIGYTQRPGEQWQHVKGAHWTAGEWNVGWRGPEEGGQFSAQAGADVCWTDLVSETALTMGLVTDVYITRIDLCCDVVGFPVSAWVAHYFAGTRQTMEIDEAGNEVMCGTSAFYRDPTGNTLYIGKRESDCFLRIYEKHHAKKKTPQVPDRLKREWAAYGWAGEPVTRIEFELKKDCVARALMPGVGRAGAWNDSLARLRLITQPRFKYAKAANARTHPDWRRLGAPEKVRIAAEPEKPLITKLLRARDMVERKANAVGLVFDDFLAAIRYLRAPGTEITDGEMFDADYEIQGPRGQELRMRGKVKPLRRPEDLDG